MALLAGIGDGWVGDVRRADLLRSAEGGCVRASAIRDQIDQRRYKLRFRPLPRSLAGERATFFGPAAESLDFQVENGPAERGQTPCFQGLPAMRGPVRAALGPAAMRASQPYFALLETIFRFPYSERFDWLAAGSVGIGCWETTEL